METKWDGTMPLLGFPGEKYTKNGYHSVLHIPVNGGLGLIEVYAWSLSHSTQPQHTEGYNLFLPGEPPVSVHTPFEAKMLIQDFLNRQEKQDG